MPVRVRVRNAAALAHELAHYFLGHPPESLRVPEEENLCEQEANAFAGALLVPCSLLREIMNRVADIELLARTFVVSRDVLTIRLIRCRLL